LFDLDWVIIQTAALFFSSTPRAFPRFTHGIFLEKTKQKSVVTLESLSLSRAFATTMSFINGWAIAKFNIDYAIKP